ncbi:MAG: histidine kinase dimerization/phosphoacceptor domain -containing protein [Pseudotabrizicola sp.]|uniref:sensor histidine kinase n=1 Tax=Pseudotabrizicola sp. TaxID=2939647 RepID=UPI00272711E7|nr:histidine kinase dimerization/phosphoacceptor domain -containing protein [Pseudotabrizicola sp.]MDO9640173.1 histidine kinase dimerization/phosphoacceptor domain -containing protein [Pseudotabrizicola sp.]
MRDSGDRFALSLMGGFEADFLLSILNASQDCVKLIEADGALSFMNENGMCALEIDAFHTVAGIRWPEMWPEPMRPTLEDALHRARSGERVMFEAECPTAKGTLKWWHVSVLPIRTADGRIHKMLAASRDITERVLREREQREYAAALERELAEKSEILTQRDFLMREVDHRVKNSLSQVASILRLQARRSPDTVREALDEAARRVASIARVHEQLQSSSDFRSIPVVPLLQRLCAEFSLSFGRPVRFSATSENDLPMLSERASALCIIVNELVANAVRHGSGSDPVTVDLQRTANGAALRVVNAASAPRPPGGEAEQGLGTLICETYATTLAGALDWQFAAGKMTATLTFSPQA